MMRQVLLLALVVPLFAQQPDAPPPPPPPAHRQMPEPKNLQVLKVPPGELIPIMRTFSASLGVRCDFCHVQGDFASDDKHEKLMARMMIRMTSDINAKFTDNQVHVACFTCHRGSKEPLLNPTAGEHQEEHPAPPPPPPAQ